MNAAAPEPSGASAGVEVAPGVWVLPDAMRFGHSRSGGPGGQNVNKLNTKVELWVPIAALRGLQDDARQRLAGLAGRRLTREGELHLVAETQRTQEANRAAVMQRLRELLIQALVRPRKRRRTRPTAASRRRRLEAKRLRGQIKSHRRSAAE